MEARKQETTRRAEVHSKEGKTYCSKERKVTGEQHGSERVPTVQHGAIFPSLSTFCTRRGNPLVPPYAISTAE